MASASFGMTPWDEAQRALARSEWAPALDGVLGEITNNLWVLIVVQFILFMRDLDCQRVHDKQPERIDRALGDSEPGFA